jgi:hypothetical protein
VAEIVDLGNGKIAVIGKKANYHQELVGRVAEDELALVISPSVVEQWLKSHSADKNDN